jgi:hypothetical protein
MSVISVLKTCPHAAHEGLNPLPVSEFPRNRRRPDGLGSWCKACNNRQRRAAYAVDPNKARENARRWAQENMEKRREAYRRWRRESPEKAGAAKRRYRAAHPEEIRKRQRRYRDRIRGQVLDHYGHTCACCGTAENLTIDHVNGGGSEHRVELFGRANADNARFYRWLIKEGFPPGFQTLCQPCNSSKKDGAACRIDHQVRAA